MKKAKKIMKIVERTYEISGPLKERSSLSKNEYFAYTLLPPTTIREVGLDEATGEFYYRELTDDQVWDRWRLLKNHRQPNPGKGLPEISNTEALRQKIQTTLMKGLNKKFRNPKKEPCKVGGIDSNEISFAVSDLKTTSHYAESDFNIDVIQKRNCLKKSGATSKQMKEFEKGVSQAHATKNWPDSRRLNGGGG